MIVKTLILDEKQYKGYKITNILLFCGIDNYELKPLKIEIKHPIKEDIIKIIPTIIEDVKNSLIYLMQSVDEKAPAKDKKQILASKIKELIERNSYITVSVEINPLIY